jgi:large subunit ribosomal protein L24
MARIKREDRVKVLSGKARGRQGKVLKVLREKDSAIVERINFVKRHTRGGQSARQQGGIIEKEAPVRLSNLMLICPHCSKPARTGTRVLEDNSRVRFCKRCDQQIES